MVWSQENTPGTTEGHQAPASPLVAGRYVEKILGRLRAGCDEAEGADWTLSADSTVVRAHQHAARARHALPAGSLVAGGITE